MSERPVGSESPDPDATPPGEPFRAWSVPEAWAPTGESVDGGMVHLSYDPARMTDLVARVDAARGELLGRTATEIAEVLGRVGGRFADPTDPLRARALAWLRPLARLSRPMAEVVVDGMARDWSMSRLRLALEAEFGDPRILDGFVPDGPRDVRAWARAPALHLGSGTVPGVTVTSMLRALMVKCPVLVKPGRGDVVLPVLFREALAEVDPALAAACAVVYWPGRQTARLPARIRTLVVYGDEMTTTNVRALAPAEVRLVSYPHRVSYALLGSDRLADPSLPEEVARAAIVYEGRGCVSPRKFFVEEQAPGSVARFGASVSEALSQLAERLPGPPPLLDEAALLRQWMDTLRMTAPVQGEGRPEVLGGLDGLVVVGGAGVGPLPPGRVVHLQPVADLSDAVAELVGLRPHLQSVALEVGEERRGGLSEALVRAGALRVTTVRHLPWPPAWWNHDGVGGMRPLVDLVDREG